MATDKSVEKKLTSTQKYAADLNIPCVNMHTAMMAVYIGAASRCPTIIAAESATGKTEMSLGLCYVLF
jgi:hypothetical protein